MARDVRRRFRQDVETIYEIPPVLRNRQAWETDEDRVGRISNCDGTDDG